MSGRILWYRIVGSGTPAEREQCRQAAIKYVLWQAFGNVAQLNPRAPVPWYLSN